MASDTSPAAVVKAAGSSAENGNTTDAPLIATDKAEALQAVRNAIADEIENIIIEKLDGGKYLIHRISKDG